MAPPTNGQLSIVAAAIAATAATGILLWNQRRSQQKPSSSAKLPTSLLESPYAEELKLAVELAFKGMYLLKRSQGNL